MLFTGDALLHQMCIRDRAKIPTVDVIAYYPDCQQSSFGPTWHTVSDDMAHLEDVYKRQVME